MHTHMAVEVYSFWKRNKWKRLVSYKTGRLKGSNGKPRLYNCRDLNGWEIDGRFYTLNFVTMVAMNKIGSR